METDVELRQLKNLPGSPIQPDDLFHVHTAGNLRFQNKYKLLEQVTEEAIKSIRRLRFLCIALVIVIIILAAGFGYMCYHLVTRISSAEHLLEMVNTNLNSHYATSLKGNTLDIQANYYSVTDISARLQTLNDTLRKLEETSRQTFGNLELEVKSVNGSMNSQFETSRKLFDDLVEDIKTVDIAMSTKLGQLFADLREDVTSLNGTMQLNFDETKRFADNLDTEIQSINETVYRKSDKSKRFADNLNTDLQYVNETLHKKSEETKRVSFNMNAAIKSVNETLHQLFDKSKRSSFRLSSDIQTVNETMHRKSDEFRRISDNLRMKIEFVNKTLKKTSVETGNKTRSLKLKTDWLIDSFLSITETSPKSLDELSTDLKSLSSTLYEMSGTDDMPETLVKANKRVRREAVNTTFKSFKSDEIPDSTGDVSTNASNKSEKFEDTSTESSVPVPISKETTPKQSGDTGHSSTTSDNAPTLEPEIDHITLRQLDSQWDKWSVWSKCSVTCGSGRIMRTRVCKILSTDHSGSNCTGSSIEQKTCSTFSCPVHGGWSIWGNWSACSRTCGDGIRRRLRACTYPRPSILGEECIGDASEYEQCHDKTCPVDGHWSDWSMWSSCSASCGSGKMTRFRACTNPAPSSGGSKCAGPNAEEKSCLVTPCLEVVNGGWSLWSNWSKCSTSCGQGMKWRERTCTDPVPSSLGSDCQGDSTEYELCYLQGCPVDGHWSAWSIWSGCSVSCGKGEMTRLRSCANPNPSNGGLNCTGPDAQMQFCEAVSCPVHGGWTSWHDWSLCSTSCGQGIRQRRRNCTDPKPSILGDYCSGDSSEYDMCLSKLCPVDGHWSLWSMWSACSVSCGKGEMTRFRSCGSPSPANGGMNCTGSDTEFQMCETISCPVHGGWTSWYDWSSCSRSCGQGIRQRHRNCTDPPPSVLGDYCSGDSSEYELCLSKACPVDGHWSLWSMWSPCSVSCGKGEMTRFRSCASPSPANGGRNCIGSDAEFQMCETVGCPVHGGWTAWHDWSLCSSSCGQGIRQRHRNCTDPPPSVLGNYCSGDSSEYELCVSKLCPVDGHWSSWSMWSACSVSCGKGETTRFRSCGSPSPSNGGLNCTGSNTEMQVCETVSCPVHGGWTAWYDWSSCSNSCGHGIRQRHRNCTDPPPSVLGNFCSGDSSEYEMCVLKLCSVDGKWTSWSMWSGCSVTCGGGHMTRVRSCSNPSPANGGSECSGAERENKTCEGTGCPAIEPGAWSSWDSWSKCSSSCGQGIRQRSRNCTLPLPLTVTGHCPGDSIEYDLCLLKACPVDGQYAAWSDWSACSVTCGSGQMRRLRSCSNPKPSGGGLSCIGPTREQKTCTVVDCPVAGGWSDWSTWSTCDAMCGVGTSQRRRDCTNPVPSATGSFCLGDPVEYKSCQGSFAEGGIRLSDGSSTNEGRVEVCYKGEWGTICDDSWDSSDAKVVCKMLGRSGGTPFSSAHYGQGSGEIFLDDVKCTGEEGSLLQCNHRGIGNHNCGHGEDAGVKCS